MSSLLNDFAVFHREDDVGAANRGKTMRDDEARAPLAYLPHPAAPGNANSCSVAVVVAALSLSYAVVSAAFTDVILANRLAIAMAKRESF